MFAFQGTSPKGGRTRRGLPGLPNPGQARGVRARQRNLLLFILVGLIMWVYLLGGTSSDPDDPTLIPRKLQRHHPEPTPPGPAPSSQEGHITQESSDQVPLGGAGEDDGAETEAEPVDQGVNQGPYSKDSPSQKSSSSSSTSSSPQKHYGGSTSGSSSGGSPGSSSPTTWEKRKGFDLAFQRLVGKLPGEIHLRDYLRNIDGMGKEKLRELGLRMRAFRDFFETWEQLHLYEDSLGNAFVRNDIQQYLRGTTAGNQPMTDEDDEDDPATRSYSSKVRAYEQYRSFISKFTKILFPFYYPFYPDLLELKTSFARGGRGIVLTAGDMQAPFLLTTIASFRKLGCQLPIEVMYLGDSDLSEDFRADLEGIPGVITRDIAPMVSDEGWKLAGWAAKPFAMLLSSFREVIFIDADSAFFRNPEELFDDPGYKKTGALFFKDRLILPENKKRWLQQILPQPMSRNVRQSRLWTGESGHMQESGVVVVDKWRHFVAMLFVTLLNGPERDHAEGRVGVYELMYGDKETFWLGWELVGDTGYSWHPGDAGSMGVVKPAKDNTTEAKNFTICAPQLVHFDVEGKPLWFNGWLLESKFADEKSKKFAKFHDYVIEPPTLREPTPWQLGEGNIACLTTDPERKGDLAQKDLDMLDWLINKAKEVRARI